MQAVQTNGSVYLHAFFAPSGLALDPSDSFYQNNTVFGKSLGEQMPLLSKPCATSIFRSRPGGYVHAV